MACCTFEIHASLLFRWCRAKGPAPMYVEPGGTRRDGTKGACAPPSFGDSDVALQLDVGPHGNSPVLRKVALAMTNTMGPTTTIQRRRWAAPTLMNRRAAKAAPLRWPPASSDWPLGLPTSGGNGEMVFHVANSRSGPRRALGFSFFGPEAHATFEDHFAVLHVDADTASIHFGVALEGVLDVGLDLSWRNARLDRNEVADPDDTRQVAD